MGGKRQKKHERIANDVYNTPAWPVKRLLERFIPAGTNWIEPCAGEGAIIKAVNEALPNVGISWTAIELRPECQPMLATLTPSVGVGDFLAIPAFETPVYDVLFTNPPFSLAQEFVEHGLRFAKQVVLLLRLNFLASEERYTFLQANMPDVYVLPNRPSFAHDGGTDSCEYAWMVFSGGEGEEIKPRRAGAHELLALTPKTERCAPRTRRKKVEAQPQGLQLTAQEIEMLQALRSASQVGGSGQGGGG